MFEYREMIQAKSTNIPKVIEDASSAAKLKYPYNIKICRRHLYGLTQAEYCNSNVLAYKRLAALGGKRQKPFSIDEQCD